MEKELVQYIAENLVNDPSAVRVESKESRSSTVLRLHVARSDMGRVIGKQGRVANAIRSLLKVSANQTNKRVILEID